MTDLLALEAAFFALTTPAAAPQATDAELAQVAQEDAAFLALIAQPWVG